MKIHFCNINSKCEKYVTYYAISMHVLNTGSEPASKKGMTILWHCLYLLRLEIFSDPEKFQKLYILLLCLLWHNIELATLLNEGCIKFTIFLKIFSSPKIMFGNISKHTQLLFPDEKSLEFRIALSTIIYSQIMSCLHSS